MSGFRLQAQAAKDAVLKEQCEPGWSYYSKEIFMLVAGALIVSEWAMGSMPSQAGGVNSYNIQWTVIIISLLMLLIVVIDILRWIMRKMSK